MVVLLSHYSHFRVGQGGHLSGMVSPFATSLRWAYEGGGVAVTIFWFLSGFIFTWKYGEALRSGSISGRAYAVFRFSRLYPLHLATLLIVLVLQLIYRHQWGEYFVYELNDGSRFLQHLFFLNGWAGGRFGFNGPTWSVSQEVAVYVVFFLAARRYSLGLVQLATAFVVIVIVGWAVGQVSNLLCLLYFVGGGAVWQLHRILAISRWSAVCNFVAVVLMAGSMYALFETPKDQIYLRFLMGTLLGLSTVFTFSSDAVRFSPMTDRLFSKAGSMTYASYLLHVPIQLLAVLILPQWVFGSALFWPGYLVVVCIVSWYSYRGFELPAQNALRRWLLPSQSTNA
jgi:peptidoglycan/LPS O-acetylase OafA/YrhL